MNYSINNTTTSISINGGDPSPIGNFTFLGRDSEGRTIVALHVSEYCNVQEFNDHKEPNGARKGKRRYVEVRVLMDAHTDSSERWSKVTKFDFKRDKIVSLSKNELSFEDSFGRRMMVVNPDEFILVENEYS